MKSALRICVGVLMLAVMVLGQYMEGEDLQALDSDLIKAAEADHLDLLIHGNYTANATIPNDTAQEEENVEQESTSQDEATPEPETDNAEGKKPSVVPKKGVDIGKPSVVPKKGVEINKPSVVPKKGVDYGPSVVPKKGADPESSTPSVSARKGVDPESATPSVSARKGVELPEPKLVSLDSPATSMTTNVPQAAVMAMENVTGISESDMTIRGKQYSIPIPQLISKSDKEVKNDKSMPTGDSTTIKPVLTSNESSFEFSNKTVSNSTNANTTLNTIHVKPIAAVDKLGATPDPEEESVNYAAVMFGIILSVAFIALVVIGYRTFKEVWMRRHYAHVDFLVEGMYDE